MLKFKHLFNKFSFEISNNNKNVSDKFQDDLIEGVEVLTHIYQLWKAKLPFKNRIIIIETDVILENFFSEIDPLKFSEFLKELIASNSNKFITPSNNDENNFLLNNFVNSDFNLNSDKFIFLKSIFNVNELHATLMSYIDRKNAKIERIHGSLMSIYGEGIIITGKSGIGKSELVLNLLNRNHLFVADDALDIIEYSGELYGKSAPAIKNYLEIRGIGIIDIKKALGIQTIIKNAKISLIIELKYLDDIKESIDRLGNEMTFTKIHNQNIPLIVIPVSQGRDLASIVEMAVVVHKMKKYDKYNFLDLFNESKKIEENNS